MTRIYEGIDLHSHEKHQAYRVSSIQEAVVLLSDSLQFFAGMKIILEEKLPIYPSLEREADFYLERGSPSEEVFAATAELCSIKFSLSPLLWNHGIAVTFCVLCTF